MADKTVQTRFFRVAVEGATASDGRVIEGQWLKDIAETFNPKTYGARVNMEHIKGWTPNGDFKAYGDVLAVRVQTDDIEIAGKTEKRLALYAQIDPTSALVAFNRERQKIYTSIEVEPNFSGTGKAYLMGLAVTDTPASLGTEALEFTTRADDPYAAIRKADIDRRKAHSSCVFSSAIETKIELEDEPAGAPGESAMDKVFAALARALGSNQPKVEQQNLSQNQPQAQTSDNAALAAAFTQFSTDLSRTLQQASDASDQRIRKIESEFAALRADIEKTPERNHSARPVHAGGDGVEQTDC